ncbi:hypothetical protein [Maridesulfovibrio sp.]|uniref:hypothetical protein n=1 Tax=Maridesulfovibrio sp. TaxID=2795000 RepID=UPI003B009A52
MPEEKDFNEAVDKSLEKSLRAEEQEFEGFKTKRTSADVLMRVRDELGAEDRVRKQGNVLQRAGSIAMRRG